MSYREIPKVKLPSGCAAPIGEPGRLEWLRLDQIVIDTDYQREPGASGERHIVAIAKAFDWRQFTPLICAETNMPGRYAAIDGQHRSAAVLARADIDKVPCWIVAGDVSDQARAFMAINAKHAKVAAAALWYARRAAGDADARVLFDLCDRAEVEICRYAKANRDRAFNECMAPSELDNARRTHGDAVTLRALRVLRRAGEISGQSLLVQSMIRAVVTLARENEWRSPDIERVAGLFAHIDLASLQAKAAVAAVKSGRARAEHVVDLIRDQIIVKEAA